MKFLLLMLQVYTWGKGYCGALGHGDEIEKTTPEILTSLKNHLAVQVLYPYINLVNLCLDQGHLSKQLN